MVLTGFPNVVTESQQYNIREKPTIILYTYININPHAGAAEQKQGALNYSNMVIKEGLS